MHYNILLLLLILEKPVASYIIQSQKKLQSQFKPSYWIEDLVNHTKLKQPIRQSKPRKLTLRTMTDSYVEESVIVLKVNFRGLL